MLSPVRAAPHLLLTYDFPPIRGGIARYMAELARRYEPGRLIVSTGSVPGADDAGAYPNAVDRMRLDARRLKTADGLVRWGRHTVALARAHGAGFAWCGNVRPAAYAAAWARWRAGLPYGIIFHGSDVLWLGRHARRSRFKRMSYRVLLDGASVLAPNSGWTRGQLLDVLALIGARVDEARVPVVPLGTDPSFFRPGLDAAPARARYGLPEGRWLVSMARLGQREKGIDTGIRVLARLGDEFPDLRYVVIVVGSTERVPELRALAESLGVGERVHFVSLTVPQDLPALLGRAEVFLGLSRPAPDWQEGFGIAFVEASACGAPVVAGRSGGSGEAVRDGETGVLVDALEPEAPAAAVHALLLDPARARAMGAAGRAFVERVANWDRVVADLTRLGDAHARVPAPRGAPTAPCVRDA